MLRAVFGLASRTLGVGDHLYVVDLARPLRGSALTVSDMCREAAVALVLISSDDLVVKRPQIGQSRPTTGR
jgi:hypothetical protein